MSIVAIRRAWRYQRGNQNPEIMERLQNGQKKKDKVTKKNNLHNNTQKTKDRATRTLLKTEGGTHFLTLNIIHEIFNLCVVKVVQCQNMILVLLNRADVHHQPPFECYIVHTGIVRHKSETKVNFEPKSNCQSI